MKLSNTQQIHKLFSSQNPVSLLIFGPDQGGVSQTLDNFLSQRQINKLDPFSYDEIIAHESNNDDIINAFSKVSLGVSAKTVVVKFATENTKKAAETFIKHKPNDFTSLVITSGDLKPSSSLRKLFELNEHAYAIPCYQKNEQYIRKLLTQTFENTNVRPSKEVLDFCSARLGSDSLSLQNELTKINLFCQDKNTISIPQLNDLLSDSANYNVMQTIDDAFCGNLHLLSLSLTRLQRDNVQPMTVAFTTRQHVNTLTSLQLYISNNKLDTTTALKNYHPKIFFKRLPYFHKQLALWSLDKLQSIQETLLNHEYEIKTNASHNAFLVSSRMLISITHTSNKLLMKINHSK